MALEHGRAVLRGVLAQEIHHRVKNNLQTVASLLRLQAASTESIDPRKALGDSVNRILAIAAVHEVLTERRDDDVDLGELVERLRSMLVQGLGAGKQVSSRLEPVSLHGERATALALVFCELLGNALEHGGDEVQVELARANGRVQLTVADNGSWSDGAREGTGLSIVVRALVRDELEGELGRRLRAGRGRRRASRRGRLSPSLAEPSEARWCAGPTRGRGRGVRILIAEDETIIRLDLREILERAGFEVCAEARDGEEAVELALSEQPTSPSSTSRCPASTASRLPAHPRRAADPDRDPDRLRPGRARLAGRRGGRLRLPREAVPRDRPAAGDPRRARPPRGAPGAARGGGVPRRGARDPQGRRAGEGPPDGPGRG